MDTLTSFLPGSPAAVTHALLEGQAPAAVAAPRRFAPRTGWTDFLRSLARQVAVGEALLHVRVCTGKGARRGR